MVHWPRRLNSDEIIVYGGNAPYDAGHMANTGQLIVRSEAGERGHATAELVMAWARDTDTGEPRYILELGPDRRGAKCACECVSCGLPLTAVNAAKASFKTRPHFRHPNGAERSECVVLAARAALLSQFRDDGRLDLPRRRKTARAIGLSGDYYDAWVEAPAERVHITSIDFQDRTMAVLTLKDGRSLRVMLTGTTGDGSAINDQGLPVPMIVLEVADAAVASMSPEEIRRKLKLVPDTIRWCGHWSDSQLQADADEAALRAVHFLDRIPDGLQIPAGLDAQLTREAVLHYEVKNILEEACQVMTPALEVKVEVPAPHGRFLRERWSNPAQMLELTHVKLEHRFGRLVPDVICEGWATGGNLLSPLLIEVTVTNHIDDDRLERIRAVQADALEIDLSRAGGRVSREELRQLVVNEVATKRWLNFLEMNLEKRKLQAKLEQQAAEEFEVIAEKAEVIEERNSRVLAMPLAEISSEYLAAVTNLCHLYETAEGERGAGYEQAEFAAREMVADAVDKMSRRGFPEAGDINLIGERGILSRILSIRLDKGMGYRVDSGMQVLNAIRQSKGTNRSYTTLFFIAARIYKPKLSNDQQKWLDDWIAEVKLSIKGGELFYKRDPAYDRLLALLFPEMSASLEKGFGKRDLPARILAVRRSDDFRNEVPKRSPAGFLENQPKAEALQETLQDTGKRDWWLKGRDLEKWRDRNPEAAKIWFKNAK